MEGDIIGLVITLLLSKLTYIMFLSLSVKMPPSSGTPGEATP